MHNEEKRVGGNHPMSHWDQVGEPIPEMFPTRFAFLKTVCIGLGIALAQFGIFAILLIKPWR